MLGANDIDKRLKFEFLIKICAKHQTTAFRINTITGPAPSISGSGQDFRKIDYNLVQTSVLIKNNIKKKRTR